MMLYQLYEMQRMAMEPMRAMVSGALSLLDLPANPMGYTPMGRVAAAALDSFEHTTRRFGKPVFGHDQTIIEGQPVAVTETVALSLPWCNLKHFRRDAHRPADPILLIVAPLSGHYPTLLRGTVEAFLPDHEVYITDWHNAKDMPLSGPGFDLDDYVDYVMRFCEYLGPQTHILPCVSRPCRSWLPLR